MIKKKNGLSTCDICQNPMLLYTCNNAKGEFDIMSSRKEYQGPTTHPHVKEWCGGHCFNVILPLILMVDDMHDIKPKTTEGKKINEWWLRNCKKSIKSIKKTIQKHPLRGIKNAKDAEKD